MRQSALDGRPQRQAESTCLRSIRWGLPEHESGILADHRPYTGHGTERLGVGSRNLNKIIAARVAKQADAADLGSAAARRKGSTPFPCTNLKLQGDPSPSGPQSPDVGGHSGAIGAGPDATPSGGEGPKTTPDVRRFRKALLEVMRLLDEGDLVTARALLVGLLAMVTSRSR